MASVNAKALPESAAAMALFAGTVVVGGAAGVSSACAGADVEVVVIRPGAGVDDVQPTRAIGAARTAIR